jgi:hypothetical protein
MADRETAVAEVEWPWPAADGPSLGPGRDSLRRRDRLPMTAVAARLPALEDGLQHLLEVAS